jgi:hypothetical protein
VEEVVEVGCGSDGGKQITVAVAELGCGKGLSVVCGRVHKANATGNCLDQSGFGVEICLQLVQMNTMITMLGLKEVYSSMTTKSHCTLIL